LSERGLSRHYRIGPAARNYDDPSYLHMQAAFQGIGLRPYAPCHLQAVGVVGSDIAVSWIRRTRVDGDSWEGVEVPLGETVERYLLRVMDGTTVLREVFLVAPEWTYSAADQAADGVSAPFNIAVAQVSTSFGSGPFETLVVSA